MADSCDRQGSGSMRPMTQLARHVSRRSSTTVSGISLPRLLEDRRAGRQAAQIAGEYEESEVDYRNIAVATAQRTLTSPRRRRRRRCSCLPARATPNAASARCAPRSCMAVLEVITEALVSHHEVPSRLLSLLPRAGQFSRRKWATCLVALNFLPGAAPALHGVRRRDQSWIYLWSRTARTIGFVWCAARVTRGRRGACSAHALDPAFRAIWCRGAGLPEKSPRPAER